MVLKTVQKQFKVYVHDGDVDSQSESYTSFRSRRQAWILWLTI